MVTAVNPSPSNGITGELVNTITSGINVNAIITVAIILFVLALAIFLWRRVKGKKNFDILVEVTPKWAYKEDPVKKQIFIKPSRLQRLMGKKGQIINEIVPVQSYSTYFVPAAYVFNKKTGTYELFLKDKNKSRIYGIDYGFFKPILFGKFKRALGLWQEGPNDFKPYEVKWVGHKQIRNVYDSESTWTSLFTQQEVREKYNKEKGFMKYLPVIIVVIMGLVFLAAQYLYLQKMGDMSKQLGAIANSIGAFTKQVALANPIP